MPVPDSCIRYKDVAAAPGTDLYIALTEGLPITRKARAEAIYQRGEKEAADLLTRYPALGTES